MLDFDLAELYETETKRLKEAVRRNIERFPADFMFEITRDEYNSLRTQFATLEKAGADSVSSTLLHFLNKVILYDNKTTDSKKRTSNR